MEDPLVSFILHFLLLIVKSGSSTTAKAVIKRIFISDFIYLTPLIKSNPFIAYILKSETTRP
jgi:hypothetical protein